MNTSQRYTQALAKLLEGKTRPWPAQPGEEKIIPITMCTITRVKREQFICCRCSHPSRFVFLRITIENHGARQLARAAIARAAIDMT
jgi:hypothetical protein